MPNAGDPNITKVEREESVDFEESVPWMKRIVEDELPAHIIFPEELNQFLRERIQDLIAENGSLRRALQEVEEKYENKLHDTSVSQSSITLGKSSEVASAKIIELSKKCREQTAEVEVLKSRCKLLEASLSKKEAELDKEKYEISRLKSYASPESGDSTENGHSREDEDRVKCLSEKLQQVQLKLYESKNTCASLKQEIHKAQKLLCSEVGENVSISGLSNQPGGWRGRAEQIRLLQQRVTELQSKLSDYEGTQKVSTGSMEKRNLAIIRNAEKERRQQIENSAKELRQAEVALESYRRKMEASKARIKVLEHELNVVKGSVAILNEKRNHDDHLIETLNNRLKAAEIRYQERETDVKNREEKIERENVNLRNELQSAQLQIDRLRRRLEEREIEIDKLKSGTVPSMESIKVQKVFQSEIQSNKIHDSPPRTMRGSREPNEYVTLALAAEAERERLLELITILNRRLDKERSDADILCESLRKERTKSTKLELKLRKIEMERVGISKVDTGYKFKFLPRSLKAHEEYINSEQTRFKLELLEEECLALKARLDTVQQDKALDLTMYKQSLERVRKIFQDACRNQPPTTVGSRSTITI